MSNDNVRYLFSEPPPAATESDYVAEFCDSHLANVLYLIERMQLAETEEEFREGIEEVRHAVVAWPSE